MILMGNGLFGKILRSPKGYFIATQFFHAFFIPIVPIDSYIVTESKFGRFKGAKIPIHPLSKKVAYLRGVLTAGILLGIPKLAWLLDPPSNSNPITPGEAAFINVAFLFSLVSIVGLISSYYQRKIRIATPEFADSMEKHIESLNAT